MKTHFAVVQFGQQRLVLAVDVPQNAVAPLLTVCGDYVGVCAHQQDGRSGSSHCD